MKTIRFLVVRGFLLIGFIISYLYLLYGQEPRDRVPISRNAAWNDLVIQIDPGADDSSKETFGKELVVIQKFLREHQSEVTVGSTTSPCLEPSTKPVCACEEPTRIWKQSATNCPTGKTKRSSGGDP